MRRALMLFVTSLTALVSLAVLLLLLAKPPPVLAVPTPELTPRPQVSNADLAPKTVPPESIAASVANTPLTQAAWQTATRLDATMSRLTGQPVPAAEETLDRLIDEFLLLQGAGLDDGTVPPAEVEARIASLEAAWGLTDAEVVAALETDELSRSDLADRVAHLILVERAIASLSAQHEDLDAWLAEARRSAQVGLYRPLTAAPTPTDSSIRAVNSQDPPTPSPTAEPAPADLPVAPRPEALAPDFALTGLDGETVRLSDLRGRPVLINFWATWCPACRDELPALQAAYERYGDRVAFVAVDVKEPAETVAPFVARFGLTFPVLLDENGAVGDRLYRVRGVPTSLFVAPDGVIGARHVGPLSEADVERYLTPLLEIKTASAADPSTNQPTITPSLSRGNQPTSAPDFRLPGAGGMTITLDDYRDRSNLVLVFYRGQT